MYYQEKKTIASIISGILIMSAYIIYGISKYQELGTKLLDDLSFWSVTMLVFIGGGIVVTILIQIIFHIVLAVTNEVSKEIAKEVAKETKCNGSERSFEEFEIAEEEDEMDKLIALKAMRNSYVIVGFGFIAALVTLSMKMPPAIMMNVLFVSFVVGSLSEGFSQLYFYRRGIKNV